MHKSIELVEAVRLLFNLRTTSDIKPSRHGIYALKPFTSKGFSNVTGIVFRPG